MQDLEEATRVVGTAGRYQAAVTDAWSVWVPNGGYLSSMALRAAAAESRFARPASYQCQFLSSPKAGPLALEVRPLRSTRVAEALAVSARQAERPVLEALIWLVDAPLEGLTHDVAPRPEAPKPDALKSNEELYGSAGSPLFHQIERRPVDVIAPEVAAEPLHRTWLRFRPTPRYEDPLVDSLRALILCDTMYWPAATNAHDHSTIRHIAPGLDLGVRFHHPMPAGEWLYCETRADVAADGLMGATSRLWCETGRLLASSATQAIFRPVQR